MKKHDYDRTKCPVLTAFRTLYYQIHSVCLIALHETFNDLMLYKDVSELTDLCFKHNNGWSTTFNDLHTIIKYKKAVLPQGNRAMPQVFFSVEVRQQHSLQV